MTSSETISSYLSRLASRQPTPGGIAAAALHAAPGAALLSMVARYTTEYAEHVELVTRITGTADELTGEALGLADADERAFQGVIDSYKLPSGSDELKAAALTQFKLPLFMLPPSRRS